MTMPTSTQTKIPGVFAGKAWQQVLARDAQADGQFVYAVRTTGIFCRPSCPSRRPERKNVRFYPSPELARAAGFRACLRCEPESAAPRADPQSAAIGAAASYLTEHAGERTKLADVAKATGVAPLTLLRGFKRVLGVTPCEFSKAQRAARFKDKMREPDTTVTEALYDAGYGSSSRLYEGADAALGMVPSSLKKGGAGELIRYTIATTALDLTLIAATTRGICLIAFDDTEEGLLEALHERFPLAETRRLDGELSYAMDAVAGAVSEDPRALQLPLDVRATAFQLRVWQALQAIPPGETRTYGQLAAEIGSPKAVRAVGAACGANPVAVAVPCHRAVGANGTLTGFRWGLERKRRLLAAEGVAIA